MKDLTPVKIFGDGHTQPSIPFGTAVLLIQDGKIRVGTFMKSEDETNPVYIDHPKNETELAARALKIIKKQKIKYLKNDVSITLICPAEISKDMIW